MSTVHSQTNLLHEVSIKVLRMAMDNANVQAENLLQTLASNNKAMELSVRPHLGGIIDFKA